MLDMIQALYAHQVWADASVLSAIAKHQPAAQDESLRKTLHHMVTVQRAFHALFVKRPFETLSKVERLFRDIHAEEIAFVNQRQEADLALPFEMPHIPGARLTQGDAHMQVVMHSQHHRGQCAARLRSLGGEPPTVDFIVWLKDRPVAWS
jgi:uncharacterized damage-inducible protein DinB